MPIESGWEVSEDRKKEYEKISDNFQDGEDPILTTKMKMKGKKMEGEGLAVLTNKNLWWKEHKSLAAGIIGTVLTGNVSHALKATDRIRSAYSLYNIVQVENKGKGKFKIHWKQFDRKGNPKVDRKGNYKVYKLEYEVKRNKKEEKDHYKERREKFVDYLQKAIDNLPVE